MIPRLLARAASFALLVTTLAPRTAWATNIAGGDLGDQTWTPAGNPYIIQGDATVQSGATLTIEEGTIVQFASTDGQLSGLAQDKVELTIKGSLFVNGTSAKPVTFQAQVGSASATWYGIVIDEAAAGALIMGAAIQHAVHGIHNASFGSILHVLSTSVDTSIDGVYSEEGSPTFEGMTVFNNNTGFSIGSIGSTTIANSVVRSNTSDGINILGGGVGTVVSITGCTIHANGSDGVEAFPIVGNLSVSITNSNITQNGAWGVYVNPQGPGSFYVDTTYSNIWKNSLGEFAALGGLSGGVGTISANPLYVSPPSNLRLTSNSPSRFSSDIGTDIGALPYVNDPTPGLYGTLWTNTTLKAAGSPYTAAGDLTVAPGVTLTIEPGVTVNFEMDDIMGAYGDTSRAELRVGGALIANGTAMSPISLTSTGANSNSWYGVDFLPTAANSSLQRAIITEALFGIYYQATAVNNTIAFDTITKSANAVYVTGGAPTFDAIDAYGNGHGFSFEGAASGTLTNIVARSNSFDGIYVNSKGNQTINLTNVTLHANGSDGLEARVTGVGNLAVNIKNANITQNGARGVYRNTAGGSSLSVDTTYSNVWNNSTANFTGAAAGVGCISSDPLYSSPPTDLKLLMGSPSMETGSSAGAPNHDITALLRPVNGDGLNGAEHDMGAYEYASAPFCGDSIVNGAELCDDGFFNGTYGYCKVDCAGQGPRCGDGTTNGPEMCDDGNPSDTDDCLSTCALATCGDGYVRAGVEQCDDANLSDADGCLNTCALGTCGDGFVYAGVEQCDDGNMSNTDGCLDTCAPATCGDGFVFAGVEQCDDGNMSDTDACIVSCLTAKCGDGFVQVGVEACDDGNMIDNDGCRNDCKVPGCGDGVKQPNEECDDGNNNDADACPSTCLNATCGDGFVEAGVEACDDGNKASGDGCTFDCKKEMGGAGGTGGTGGTGGEIAGGGAHDPAATRGDGCAYTSAGTPESSTEDAAIALIAAALVATRRRRACS